MVIDSNDCPRADTFEVIEVDLPFNAFASADTITCIKTEATLSGFSDSTNVTFDWSGPNGFSASGPTVMTSDSGLYILTVTYDSLCSTTDTVRVVKADGLPDVSLTGDTITCLQDTVLLIGSSNSAEASAWTGPDGYSFLGDSAKVFDPGWYYYSVIDGNGCSAEDSIFIPALTDSPEVTLTADTITCLQDSVDIVSSGEISGNNIVWTTPAGTINNVSTIQTGTPGQFIIEVTNEYGCIGRDTLEVVEDKTIPAVSLTSDTITCTRRTITIQTNTLDPISSAWSGPGGYTSTDTNPMIMMPGTYTLIASGSNGCDTTLSIEIFADTVAPIINLQADTLDCQTPEVLIDPQLSETGTYNWNGPSGFTSQDQAITVRDSGKYMLTFTAENGCESVAEVDIVQTEDTPDVQAQGDTITCTKDSALIVGTSITPDVMLSWSGPNGYSSNNGSNIVRDSGTYTFTVVTMAGCTSSVDIDVILDTTPPEILSVSSDGIPCDSMFTTIRVEADSTVLSYNWDGPGSFTSDEQNPRVSDIGWYVITVTGINGCTSVDSIFVVAQDVLPDINATTDTLTCTLTSARLIASSNTPNVTFEWSGPSGFTSMDTIANTSTAGIYTLTVRDENGCTSRLDIQVPVDSSTATGTGVSEPIRCESVPGEITITTQPTDADITWIGPDGRNGNGSNVNSELPGTYTFQTIHPKTGCIDSFEVDLLQSADTITSANLLVRDIGCTDSLGSIEVVMVNGGEGPFTYQLNSGIPQAQPIFPSLTGGRYDITVFDQYGCPFMTSGEIDEAVTFNFSLPPDQSIKKGESTTIVVNTDAQATDIDTITWTPDTDLSCSDCLTSTATPMVTTTYTVTMIDLNGCEYEDEITINVEDNTNVYIPNAFSPNGDNLNDIFYIYGPESEVVNSLRIFDRWGEQVFLSTNGTAGDPSHGWDGTFNGERAPGGVYVYLAEITINGVTETRQGGITIIE
jgi:gliding motility-associated-like protein